MSSVAPVLQVRGLKKTFITPFRRLRVPALKKIDFDINAGEITGFLGANGAGKTTTIKCLLELAFPDEGEITYFGQKGLSLEAKARIGFLPERPYFYEHLTGLEFLQFYGQLSGRIRGVDLRRRAEELLERVKLQHAGARPLRGYSKGMLQRIGIAQALIHRPDFVILDEPMTGLDPDGRFEVREIIREVAQQGTAVFFSSHLLPDAEQLCRRLVIVKKGEMVFEGGTHELLEQVQRGWLIHWRSTENMNELKSETVADLVNLQVQIDAIRKRGGQIEDVTRVRASLEEIFMKIGFEDSALLKSQQGRSPEVAR